MIWQQMQKGMATNAKDKATVEGSTIESNYRLNLAIVFARRRMKLPLKYYRNFANHLIIFQKESWVLALLCNLPFICTTI